ncbi:MAG: fructose-1,6-bisphosphatase [Cytophagales bacterium]|nr:fructose-1,6-bisphosphatase [Cytophagales bacterium]
MPIQSIDHALGTALARRETPQALAALSIIRDIAVVGQKIYLTLNQSNPQDLAQERGINPQGERQKFLDHHTNELFYEEVWKKHPSLREFYSEEGTQGLNPKGKNKEKQSYFDLYVDPLDGSSNIDVNISIGSIFSLKYKDENRQAAAGYLLYGPTMMLMVACDKSFVGDEKNHTFLFSHDMVTGSFTLIQSGIKTPEKGKIYSLNEGLTQELPQNIKANIQKYLCHCKDEGYTARYTGSLVADFHRNLIKGGVFFYPPTRSHPKGKLRLNYECHPLAFIAEGCGGKASDGLGKPILSISSTHPDQRSSLLIGTQSMVEEAEQIMGSIS